MAETGDIYVSIPVSRLWNQGRGPIKKFRSVEANGIYMRNQPKVSVRNLQAACHTRSPH